MARMLWRLPVTNEETVTCHDYLGKAKTHGLEQRYVSPTTGACRKLVIQAVKPSAPSEVPISNHNNQVSKLALWLLSNNPIRNWIIFRWIVRWIFFQLKLLLSVIWFFAQLFLSIDLPSDSGEDNTGYYKPYVRQFQGQLWAARSTKEYSSRIMEEGERDIPTHTLYPRLVVILDKTKNEWVHCTDRETIIRTRFVAISFCTTDVYKHGSLEEEEKKKAQFKEEVRATVIGLGFDAYWLDLECIGKTQAETDRDVYCMADVYRGAEVTLIMLGEAGNGEEENKRWKSWGGRMWTLPEALLSARLCYKFRDRDEVKPLSLHTLANLAYTHHDTEQAIVNAYSGKDPLERLERLTLLKSAIWQRVSSTLPIGSNALPPPQLDLIGETPVTSGYKADRVYALMGFFEHRIKPSKSEEELQALVRLSMANDNDRIIERMVSMLPSSMTKTACWYAENDTYGANLWDIFPETQVAGVTKNGALVVDGCRAAAIRWKDFPEVAFGTTNSLKRTVVGCIPYFSWPTLIIGIGIYFLSEIGGIVLIIIGLVLLIVSPKLFVFSESGRIVTAQPWFIGVKGVISIGEVEEHLYGGARGHFPRMFYTPSGSRLSTYEKGDTRGGSERQYEDAKLVESGAGGGQMYTLIDTYSSTMYYFQAERAPTVCIFTGREGGLGRFVLCSERCNINELHKESVLRMPTEISQKMELCGWLALV